MNAFTGQELTAYYVRVPDRYLDLALDILADIVWSPALRADEIESERQVILEEIRMRDDTPDDLVHDVFAGALFPHHPLGREISGSQETIAVMPATRSLRTTPTTTAVERRDRGGRQRRPRRRGRAHGGRAPRTHRHPSRPGQRRRRRHPRRVRRAVERPLEQSHVVLGNRALRRDDPDRFALAVVDQVLGGGMSSRLFQEVREKRGLAYSVFSYRSAFEETGSLAVYCGTAPERVEETLAVVRGELDRLVADGGVTDVSWSAPRDTSPGRWPCRSRARRAACTASVAPSSRMGEVPEPRLGGRAGRRGHRRRHRSRDRPGARWGRTQLAAVGPPDTLP